MTTQATILADSVSPLGKRLVTFDLTFPMFVQPQLLRHRTFSFSVQSTRAVPLAEQIRRVREEPCSPGRWGAARRGMVAVEEVSETTARHALSNWEAAASEAATYAERLLHHGIHQEVAARLLAPFQWCRCIVSATEWDNFFALRVDSHAQAEIRDLAEKMRDAMAASTPRLVGVGEWHLPMVDDEDRFRCSVSHDAEKKLCLVSAGRCARVSFLQHDGTRDFDRDLKLGTRLASDAHWSPLEHQASPMPAQDDVLSGNFRGWVQFRKTFAHEDNRKRWLEENAR